MEFSAQQIASVLGGTVEGDPEVKVNNFSKIEEGKPGTLTFLANPKYEHFIYQTEASIVLVNNDFTPAEPVKATLVKVANAYASLAILLNMAEQANVKKAGIDATAFIAGSAYGIFFAAEAPDENSITVQQAVEQLTGEYREELEHISDTVPHDRQEIETNDGVYYIRWQDVLAVFSSYVSGNEQGAPVAALTEEQVDKLRETMWAMNAVDCSTHPETTTIETTDEDGNPTTTEITETVLVIELTHKTPDEMAADYHFTTRQNTYLQLLQDPQYEELWAELLGGFAQGGGELMNPDSTRIPTGTLQWPLPVAGTITSQFGHRVDPITGEVSSHTGTDIACAEGTPILAAADGIVTVANGLDSWGGSYGYYIQIDHGGGLETLYAHCSSICVTTGQQVQSGQVIGYVGHTGRATGSHLHFEIHINKIRKDAMSYFGM